MKWISLSVYTIIVLNFIRKLLRKVSLEPSEIQFYKVDDSGCYCVDLKTPEGWCAIAYSFSLEKARHLAYRIQEELPRYKGKLRVVEDDDAEVEGLEVIPSQEDRKLISHLIEEVDS